MNLSALTVKPLLWVIGILLVVIAGMGAGMYVTGAAHDVAMVTIKSDRDGWKGKAEARATRLAEVSASNKANADNVKTLAAKLEEAVGKNQETARILAAAEAARDAARAERDRALSRYQAEREKAYATNTTCGSWGSAPVCGVISDSVRQQWEQTRSGDSGADRAGGRGASAAGADQFYPDRGAQLGTGTGTGDPAGSRVRSGRGLLQ